MYVAWKIYLRVGAEAKEYWSGFTYNFRKF